VALEPLPAGAGALLAKASLRLQETLLGKDPQLPPRQETRLVEIRLLLSPARRCPRWQWLQQLH
jgi:hypothetical protein